MDRATEIRDFLISRRARITPEQAGIPFSPARVECRGFDVRRWRRLRE